ncbi:uncharacterized protein V6R79_011824 [Siganus canaliculatus]
MMIQQRKENKENKELRSERCHGKQQVGVVIASHLQGRCVFYFSAVILPAPHPEENPPLKQPHNVSVSLTALVNGAIFSFYTYCWYFTGGMAYRGQGQKVQKVMVQPINLIFRYLQNRSRIQVWLYEQVNMRIEGCIIGFDEYMNLVLDDAEEVHMKTKNRKPLGRIMLKGDNITLLQSVSN